MFQVRCWLSAAGQRPTRRTEHSGRSGKQATRTRALIYAPSKVQFLLMAGRAKFLLLVIGVPVAFVTFIVWMVSVPHTPELSAETAAHAISDRPEFNRTRSMVNVSATMRCRDSLKDVCYNAEFTFNERGSATQIKAFADFHYWDHDWHLNKFQYGEAPDVEIVSITSGPKTGR